MAEDLTECIFGSAKVIEKAKDRITPSGQKRKFWLCECQNCASRKEVSAQDLKRGSFKICTCMVKMRTKNIKICVECGKEFESPPSDLTNTCSKKCSRKHKSKIRLGVKRSDEIRRKLSEAAKGRDMSDLQKMGTKAAQESLIAGRFETNQNAIDWHLISPEGKHYYFHSLNFWLRENCQELFGCEPDSREYKNARSGLSGAKRAAMGKNYGCCTYKGWQVLPTEDDLEKK